MTGVVDWNLGVRRGDRRYALVCLCSDWEWRVLSTDPSWVADDDAVEMLDRVIATTEQMQLLKCGAHCTLQRLHWTVLDRPTTPPSFPEPGGAPTDMRGRTRVGSATTSWVRARSSIRIRRRRRIVILVLTGENLADATRNRGL